VSSNGKELLGERYERGHLTTEDGGCIPRRDDAHVARLRTRREWGAGLGTGVSQWQFLLGVLVILVAAFAMYLAARRLH